MNSIRHFFSLTPHRVLDAVEQSGCRTTGLCYPLNSLENRVYEVELEDKTRLVGKFYRPGRWSFDAINDEHRLLAALVDAEVPVCAPVPFPDGRTIHTTTDDIFFCLFPKTGGRAPEELSHESLEQLGRLLGRIHNVSASLGLQHRQTISHLTYGRECLDTILRCSEMSQGVRARYEDAVVQLIECAAPYFENVPMHAIHGDCHRGNLLYGDDGWFFLDFDDMGIGPAVQDLWLLIPGRHSDCEQELNALLRGYEQFRDFDRTSLGLIEILRGLRYVRYAAWILTRWQDPSFTRTFSDFGTDNYWEEQVIDIHDQLNIILPK